MTDTSKASRRVLALTLALAAPLAACSTPDRIVTGSAVPNDFRARHPVVLANAPQTLDIFVPGANGRLDDRQLDDVKDLARRYNAAGTGVIQILAPRGSSQDAAAARTAGEVRAALGRAGVRGYVDVGHYQVTDPRLAAPVRVSYAALEAQVASRCGQWPDDLAGGTSTRGWDNRPWWNLGCATQQNIAAQVADPRDLVRPRKLDPADSQMRIRAIMSVRGDPDAPTPQDPTTPWPVTSPKIGNVLQ